MIPSLYPAELIRHKRGILTLDRTLLKSLSQYFWYDDRCSPINIKP